MLSRSLSMRSLASLVALLLLGTQLGSAVHLAAVQHTICVEHGEVVDVPHAAIAAPSAHATLQATPALHGHEHCTVDALLSPRFAFARTHAAPHTQSYAVSTNATSYVAPPRVIALLHLAPKSSPPVSLSS